MRAVTDAKAPMSNKPPERGTAEFSEEWAQTKILIEKLNALPIEFIKCRAYRHSWDILHDFHDAEYEIEGNSETVWYVVQDLQCSRCTMVRHDYYLTYERAGLRRLEKVDMAYERPLGYDLAGVPRGTRPQEVVLATFYDRMVGRAAHAQPGEQETADA